MSKKETVRTRAFLNSPEPPHMAVLYQTEEAIADALEEGWAESEAEAKEAYAENFDAEEAKRLAEANKQKLATNASDAPTATQKAKPAEKPQAAAPKPKAKKSSGGKTTKVAPNDSGTNNGS